jgi:polysaccharide chain length determinant protein (PEP-CTERM system associated)
MREGGVNEIFDLLIFYLNALWKRRWIVLLGAWAVAIPGWAIVAMIPNVYESSSRVFVDTSGILQPLLKGIAVQNDVPSQVQLMNQTLLSRPNLEAVTRATDYDLSLDTDAEKEALFNSLRERTTILSTKEDIFLISVKDTDPQRAHDVVQALLSIFVESNLGRSRKDFDTAEEFIDKQIADYEARLEEAESKLARFKQENIEVALGGDNGYLGRANAAANEAKELQQDLEVAIAQRDLLRQELASIPATVPMALTNVGPPDDTEVRIVELEARLRQLLAQYTEKHPDVVTTQRQLDVLLAKQEATRAALEAVDPVAATESPLEEYGEPNPIYDQVKLRVIEMETQIEDLRQRATAARRTADLLASKAEEVPKIEAEFQKLNRDYSIVKGRHDELLARRESARMSRSRDDIGQEVQYRMIEPPIVPNEPIGPNRQLFLNVVAFGALSVGLSLAVVLIVLDTSFSSLSDLRQYTRIAVLGAVTDAGIERKPVGRFTGGLALGCCVAAFVAALVGLNVVERQVGLYSIASTGLGEDAFERGLGPLLQQPSEWLN